VAPAAQPDPIEARRKSRRLIARRDHAVDAAVFDDPSQWAGNRVLRSLRTRAENRKRS
jgi:hypothetical protein